MTKLLTLLSTIVLAVSGSVSQTVWVDDPAHSQVSFSVAHLVIAEVTGRFKEFTVTLQQTAKEDFTGSILEATIKTASVDTDNEARDKHLRSDDFFNAEKFPEITFKSTSIEKSGTDTYKVIGNLTIRDVTKPVVFEARHTGQVKDPWGNVKIGFKATASVNRFDYGLKWDKAIETGGLVAGDVVDITLLMEMAQRK
ncbi:MAG: polyisoprenoid-binding protein [Bacteroidetes bacterium]|nr:polyisoprenoid-binding protein [Bacteroidota bacterium]